VSPDHTTPDAFNTEAACPGSPGNLTYGGHRKIDANDPLQTLALVAAWACAKNFDTILSPFFDHFHLPD
jgi:hypothetical protein